MAEITKDEEANLCCRGFLPEDICEARYIRTNTGNQCDQIIYDHCQVHTEDELCYCINSEL